MRAGIYTRISEDDGTALGVARQEEDGRAEAARREWEIVGVYTDNDVSATRSKVRPQYKRLMHDIASGLIQAVLVWDVDRLTRTPREIEDMIDLADKTGLVLVVLTGAGDFGTDDGRMMLRIKAAFARREVEQMRKRLKRTFLQKAQKGEPHGFAPYGYKRVPVVDADGNEVGKVNRDIANEEQAAVIREAAQRVLASESLRSIVADLNARGIHGPRAEKWNSTILRQILIRPSNAGLRSYQGKVIGKSNAEPIYDEDMHNRLVSLLTDPSRRANHVGPGFKYLLSGIAICGLCGGVMRRQVGRTVTSKRAGTTKRQPPSYCCSKCFRVRRKQAPIDEIVSEVLIARLSMPDAAGLFATSDTVAAKAAQKILESVDAKLNLIADQFADDEITAAQLKRITSRLRAERKQAENRLRAAQPHTVLAELVGGDVRARWESSPMIAKREVIEALMTVTIRPSGSGRRFDPEDVVIAWNTP